MFLDHLLRTDGHRKHNSGMVLVLGAFDHGHEHKNVWYVLASIPSLCPIAYASTLQQRGGY